MKEQFLSCIFPPVAIECSQAALEETEFGGSDSRLARIEASEQGKGSEERET